jgi:catechol 2,3-dioxygenase-like lactoylglutathione lyase family enzyme
MAVVPSEVVQSKGPAAGRIAGMSHIVFICRDMDETVRFYRDILGLKLISTSGTSTMKQRDAEDAKDSSFAGRNRPRRFTRQYFFQLGNGEGFGFYEVPDAPDGRETTPLPHWYWPGAEDMPPERPHKVDHFAFHVPTKEDVQWYMNRLTEHGIDFIGPFDPRPGSPPRYLHRIYFWDPSGNPLEIASMVDESERPDDPRAYFLDSDPVPAATEA